MMSDVFGTHEGVYLPSMMTMIRAYDTAMEVKNTKRPAEVQDAYNDGLGSNGITSSVQLTQDANDANSVEPGATLEDMFFTDFLSAEYYRSVVRPDKEVADATIPASTLAQQLHVHQLVLAFHSTYGCEDNAQMVKPFLTHRHDPKLVEAMCWTVLTQCISRAKSDHPLLLAYEPSKARNTTNNLTFAERFDLIADAMARSKTICKHLYDSPYVFVFVDDPDRAVRRVNANRDLNRQKGEVMGKGKEVLELELKAAGAQTPESTRKRRVAVKEELDESPLNEKRVRRGSVHGAVTMSASSAASGAMTAPLTPSTPMVGAGAGVGAGASTGSAGVYSYGRLIGTPTSAAVMEAQSSPLARFNRRMEEESPDSPAFGVRSAHPLSYTSSPMISNGNRAYGSRGHGHGASEAYSWGNGNGNGNGYGYGYGNGSSAGRRNGSYSRYSPTNRISNYPSPENGYVSQLPTLPPPMFNGGGPALSARNSTARLPHLRSVYNGTGTGTGIGAETANGHVGTAGTTALPIQGLLSFSTTNLYAGRNDSMGGAREQGRAYDGLDRVNGGDYGYSPGNSGTGSGSGSGYGNPGNTETGSMIGEAANKEDSTLFN